MCHTLADRGACELLGVTISKDNPLTVSFVDAQNTFYRRPDLPIGVTRDPAAQKRDSKYLKLADSPDYPHDLRSNDQAREAVDLLRELLAKQPDQQYTLHIGSDLTDAEGQPLGRAFSKVFRTSAEDHDRPLIEKWKIESPPAQTSRPLVLQFPKPLDRALLDRFLTVTDAEGKTISGRIEVGADERSWSFHPVEPWKPIGYTIVVDGNLEVLAGNNLLHPFDVRLDEPEALPPKLTLPFHPE